MAAAVRARQAALMSTAEGQQRARGMTGRHGLRGAIFALVVLSAIWGYNWVVMKVALADATPIMFAALRTFLGAVVLFLVLAVLRKPLAPKALPATFLLGLLQTTGFVGFTIWALEEGGAGKTAVLVYTMPFWVLVLAWPFLGERLRGAQWWAVALAFGGLVFILTPWQWQGAIKPKLLAVLAGLAWAASTLVAKHMRRRTDFDLLSLTAWQMLLGALPLVFIAGVGSPSPIHWSPAFVVALLYNVIPGNAIAWLLWLYILHRLPAGLASMGMLATPVIGVLAAWLQLGEAPGVDEGAGMLLIGVALALLSIEAIRHHARVNPGMAQE
jgi:drug/metabolite transporter (DMT)-like permease